MIRIASRHVPFGTVVYALVLAVVAAGLAVLALGPWRLGVSLCGGAFAAAAIARVAVPERSSGLLRMRRRLIDLMWMVAIGGLLITLAIIIPSQPAP